MVDPKRSRNRRSVVNKRLKEQLVSDGISACEVCGWCLPKHLVCRDGSPWGILHVHHVVPVACGGSETDRSNVALLCPNHHAMAHVVGARFGVRWYGAKTRDELIANLKRLDHEPEAVYLESQRKLMDHLESAC